MDKMKLSNKSEAGLLVLILALLGIVVYYPTIQLFPAFIHAWTQSDRYAIALRFLDNGFDLFHPATFNLQTVNGVTRVDLPLNEFIVALIMKISGSTAPLIFRIYTLCISFIGLAYLYLFSKRLSGSAIKSVITVMFVFFSPVYFYYQAGFIPSIPAIACVFAAYYYFFSYKEKQLQQHLHVALILFLVAALIRLPFVIFLFAALLQQAFMGIKGKRLNKGEALLFLFMFAVFGGYYFYNVHLGRIYGNMFLDSFMPVRNTAELRLILAEMYNHWCFQYFTMWHYILMFLLVFISVLTFYKRKGYIEEDKKYWFQLFIISCGTLIYFFMMARQFYSHDYYFLDSLFVPVILLFVLVLKNISIETKNERVSWTILFSIFIILFFISNNNTQEERYKTGPWDRVEITRQNFMGSEKFLDSIGVPKDAKILVIDAYTTNAPLILMNRKGYTVMGTTYKNIGTALQWCKWDYVAIQDIYLVSDVIKNYPPITQMLEKVNGNGRISLYKRSSSMASKTLKQFLGITPERTVFKFEYKANAEHKIGQLDPQTEFGITATVKAKELKSIEALKMLVTIDFSAASSLADIQLVAAVSSGEGQLFYESFALEDYFKTASNSQQMEFQFVLPGFKTPEDELKVYLWNPGKQSLSYDNMEVTIYK